jgi:hypothetical protein
MKTLLPHAPLLSGTILLLTAATLPLRAQLKSYPFGPPGNQFTMDFVTIGNSRNLPDTTGAPNPAGSVAYVYEMGKYEVNRDMIIKANTLGGLGITLADMSAYGGNGGNRPATGVTWYEAAAFVNWLNTSTGHQPAYNLAYHASGGMHLNLWPSADAWQLGGQNLYRHKDTYYFLPNENEWYKAAYCDAELGVYYDYPTGSDTPPTAVQGGIGAWTAVYNQPGSQGPADIMNAGGLSPYGTMGQGGNVNEWTETAYDMENSSGGEYRVLRGGYWNSLNAPRSSYRNFQGMPGSEYRTIGFRVAAIPEPVQSVGVMGLVALGFAARRRRISL